MKREFGNKDFLPYKLINKKEKELNKVNKLMAVVLIITSLVFLPISINKVLSRGDEKKENMVNVETEITYSKESIINWLDIISELDEGYVNDYEGIFIINGKDDFNNLSSNKAITIKSIEYIGDEKYKVIFVRSSY